MIALVVLLALAATEDEERAKIFDPKICESVPKDVRRDSSNEGYLGIGGPRGRSCAPKELYWLSADRYASMCSSNGKGKPLFLGAGMAEFSPDCRRFWAATSEGIDIHDAQTGVRLHRVKGEEPAWPTPRRFTSREARRSRGWMPSGER